MREEKEEEIVVIEEPKLLKGKWRKVKYTGHWLFDELIRRGLIKVWELVEDQE